MLNQIKKVAIYSLIGVLISQQPILSYAQVYENTIIDNSNYNDIDDEVFNLRYDKREILATEGESVESFLPREGKLSKDKFIVVERKKKSVESSPVDISIIDSMTDRTFPGALQLADKDFVNNEPNLISVDRKPMNISIDLPGLKDNHRTVENPNYANVNKNINEMLRDWSDNYSNDYNLPARIQYSETMVHSKSQLGSSLNINPKILGDALGIDFQAIKEGEKKVMVAAYKQIFYTVSSEMPNNPSDLFGENVRFRDLERRGVSDDTPPTMVSNVAYGRTIYVKLETNSKSKEVESAFKAVLAEDNSIKTNVKYKDILDESSFTAVVLGGDSQKHNNVITKDFDEIRDIIRDNAEFSLKNPAYPISYTSVFLKDNSVAKVHNRAEYIETTAKEFTSGRINIDHSGAYVAQFEILWDELSFDDEGNEILTPKAWEGNWQDKTARFTSTVYLPANATNIRVYARECTGLAWEWWRTVVDERHIPLSKAINLSIWGTTLHPKGQVELNNEI